MECGLGAGREFSRGFWSMTSREYMCRTVAVGTIIAMVTIGGVAWEAFVVVRTVARNGEYEVIVQSRLRGTSRPHGVTEIVRNYQGKLRVITRGIYWFGECVVYQAYDDQQRLVECYCRPSTSEDWIGSTADQIGAGEILVNYAGRDCLARWLALPMAHKSVLASRLWCAGSDGGR